jgi:hypothetical protein
VGQGARNLYKDLRTVVSSARRNSGRLTDALQRDFDQAQKRLKTGSSASASRKRTATGRRGKSTSASRRRSASASTRSSRRTSTSTRG